MNSEEIDNLTVRMQSIQHRIEAITTQVRILEGKTQHIIHLRLGDTVIEVADLSPHTNYCKQFKPQYSELARCLRNGLIDERRLEEERLRDVQFQMAKALREQADKLLKR